MRHQSQNGFLGIFIVITQHQKGYLIYVPSKRKIFSSRDVVFYGCFSSDLSYMARPYSEELATQPSVSYITYTS